MHHTGSSRRTGRSLDGGSAELDAPVVVGEGALPARVPFFRIAIAVLLIAHLVPIWIVPHYPSQDGPSHVYLAWVLQNYADHPGLQWEFILNLRPFPNWLCYALLQPLLWCFTPATAERMLWSIYAIALPLSFFYLLDAVHPGRRLLGFLVFPFVFGFSMQLGLMNFCLGLPVCFVAIGFWWKHRDDLRWRTAAGLLALLLLAWFAHLVAFAATIGSIAVLALLTARASLQSRLRLMAVFAMLAPLVIWYLLDPHAATPTSASIPDLHKLVDLPALVTYDAQSIVSYAFVGLVAFLVLVTLATRVRDPAPRATDAFAVLGAIFAAATLWLPNDYFLADRASVFPFLLLLPALRQELSGLVRGATVVMITAVTAMQLAFTVHFVTTVSRTLECFLAGVDRIEPGANILPFIPDARTGPDGSRLVSLAHAINDYALAAGGVNLSNFHSRNANFPVLRRRPEGTVDLRELPHYVVAWEPDGNTPRSPAIDALYEPVFTGADGRLRILRTRSH